MQSHHLPNVKVSVKTNPHANQAPPHKDAPHASKSHEQKTFDPYAALPASNISETARLVYASLTALHTKQFSITKRAKHLEAFRPSVHYATEHLAQLYAKHALPLPPAENNAAVLVSELYIQMAHGYKKLAAEMLTANKSRLRIRQISVDKVVAALYRAISYVYRFHLSCYLRYAPIPDSAWNELHQLYAYAEKHALHTLNVDDHEAAAGHSTISHIYKQALLLHIANPYHYSPDEIPSIVKFLEEWAQLCNLRDVFQRNNDAKLFVARLTSAEPPMSLALCPHEPDASWRSIDTVRLIAVLRELITMSNAPANKAYAQADILPPKTLQNLLRTYALASLRIATRADKKVRLWVTMGLADTYLCINQERVRSEPKRHSAIFPCTLINESAGGACLLWRGDLTEKLRIGEIIGLYADENGGKRAQIGAARWITNVTENIWMIGLQRLVDNAEAVAAKTFNSQGKSHRVMAGLLLAENNGANLPPTLVLPTLACRTGDKVSVLRRGKEFNLQLAQVVETSTTFTRFMLRGNPTANNTSAKKSAIQRGPLRKASGF